MNIHFTFFSQTQPTYRVLNSSLYANKGLKGLWYIRLLCLILVSCCFSLSALAQNTWTGAVSGNWATTGNWSLSAVPTATNNVVIPSGTLNSPTITASTTAVARSVEVQSGAQLTIGNSATLTISISKMISGSATSLYNAGTVNNNGLILIGSQVNTARDYGISNPGTFNNNSGARIQIDRSANTALFDYSPR